MKTISLLNRTSIKTCPNCGRTFSYQILQNLEVLFGDLFDDYNQLCPICKPQIDNTPYVAEAINRARYNLLQAC